MSQFYAIIFPKPLHIPQKKTEYSQTSTTDSDHGNFTTFTSFRTMKNLKLGYYQS